MSALGRWEEAIKCVDFDSAELPEILDALMEHLGLVLIRESTPDYTSYRIAKKEQP